MPSPQTACNAGSLDNCLLAAQAKSPGAADVFISAHGLSVARAVMALCRRFGVPRHEHEDVVQETYRRLFDPHLQRLAVGRGSAKSYIRGVILNAIDVAGRRRRARRVGGEEPISKLEQAEVADARWEHAFAHVEARADLTSLLRLADPLASRAVALMCADGLTQRDAAKLIGVSEFKLSRTLAKLSHKCGTPV